MKDNTWLWCAVVGIWVCLLFIGIVQNSYLISKQDVLEILISENKKNTDMLNIDLKNHTHRYYDGLPND